MLRRLVLSALLLFPLSLSADEGMWSFHDLPLQQMKAKYGFAPDQAWLDHLRLATVVFGNEGTGAFVGRGGLILTNQHVAHAYVQSLSDQHHDWVQQGFVAQSRGQELRVPSLTIRVLASMQDITREVEEAVQPGLPEEDATAARSAVLQNIQQRETAESGLFCETVDFHQGGEYWIYRYRKFSDVRLVMVPEYDIAAFGKEWDNFAYPRHDLDFCLFRVYENGQPFRSAHSLLWTRKGIPNGGLTLVAGHPGRTNRQETWAQMDFRRRAVNPLIVETLERKLKTLTEYGARSEEKARRVSADIMEAANFLKVYREEIRGLEDPVAAKRIQTREQELRVRIDRDPAWKEPMERSWKSLAQLFQQQETLAKEYQLLHRNYGSLQRGPFARALRLVRLLTQPGHHTTPTEFLEAMPWTGNWRACSSPMGWQRPKRGWVSATP